MCDKHFICVTAACFVCWQDADTVSHVFFSETQRNYDYVWHVQIQIQRELIKNTNTQIKHGG